ncbi:hypothetical protein KPL78_05395 [Roseomonas sp. HJA6]|uniref:Uncharacterized protein n=1 Tax=Roseomonas alba TaxID=2846776 RepID=A0ABS7A4S3_9PROT|nr:hypothetical protein [Neoroseomonas alba]MBW6397273.1 hypothetical protein [Neoroseomonas alba]
MADQRLPVDPWPLLPRRLGPGESRSTTEPAEAAFTAAAVLAGLFLLLRWITPGLALAPELARLVALLGCLGGMTLAAVLMALLVGAAFATPMMPMAGPLKTVGLAIFDHMVHLALVLTIAGLVGLLVLHGPGSNLAALFVGQALLLWLCHRTRLWLSGRSAA